MKTFVYKNFIFTFKYSRVTERTLGFKNTQIFFLNYQYFMRLQTILAVLYPFFFLLPVLHPSFFFYRGSHLLVSIIRSEFCCGGYFSVSLL